MGRPWVAIAVTVVLTGALFLGLHVRGTHRLPSIAGHPEDGFSVFAERGRYLVLTDAVNYSSDHEDEFFSPGGYRLTAVDAASGKQAGQRIFDDSIACWPARGLHLWCDYGGQLLSLELPSFATFGDVSTLATAGGHALVKGRYANDDGDLRVLFTDGSGARIDGETLEVKPGSGDGITRADRGAGNGNTSSNDLQLADHSYLRFTGQPKHLIGHAATNYGAFTPPPGAPSFLRLDRQPDFLVTADRALVLVWSDASLDPDPMHLLSRVDARGEKLLWSLPLPRGGIGEFRTEGNTLWLTVAEPQLRAIAVDLETGKALWRFAYPEG